VAALRSTRPCGGELSESHSADSCRWQFGNGAAGSVAPNRNIVIFCTAACIAAACWEFVSAEEIAGDAARRLAANAHLYHERETAQIAVTLAVLACVSWLAIRIMERTREPRGIRWVLLGLTLFAGTNAVAAISHHAIDRIAYAVWWGVPAMQWMKIASGGFALAGAGGCRRGALTRLSLTSREAPDAIGRERIASEIFDARRSSHDPRRELS